MLNLVDGPCRGTYMCRRAPKYLRAVKDDAGNADCLDQIEDTPKDSEKVYIYEIEGLVGTVHLHMKKGSGWYAFATYRYIPGVDGEALRDNIIWQEWTTDQANALSEEV